MLRKYDLSTNKWLANIFKIREKWALVYGRKVFCADMMSTQRSESINSVIKTYLDPKQRLLDFFNHWERLLESRRHAKLVANSRASQGNPKVSFSKMLKQALVIYTPTIYKVFKDEYGRFLDCSIKDNGQRENVHEYIVTIGRRERIVQHDLSTGNMTCTCLKFEFTGIQCCYVIKALDFMNIKQLPEKYFLKRWHKNAKAGTRLSLPNIEIEYEVHVTERYSFLARSYNDVFSIAAHSTKAYRYALGMVREVMSKVEKLALKESQSGQIDDNRMTPKNEASRVNLEATSAKPTGIRKKDVERGRRRYPSSLETNKKTRTIGKPTNLSNSRSTDMSSNANLDGHVLIYSQTSKLTETHSYGYATGLLNAIHALSTTNTSLLDFQDTNLAGLEQ